MLATMQLNSSGGTVVKDMEMIGLYNGTNRFAITMKSDTQKKDDGRRNADLDFDG